MCQLSVSPRFSKQVLNCQMLDRLCLKTGTVTFELLLKRSSEMGPTWVYVVNNWLQILFVHISEDNLYHSSTWLLHNHWKEWRSVTKIEGTKFFTERSNLFLFSGKTAAVSYIRPKREVFVQLELGFAEKWFTHSHKHFQQAESLAHCCHRLEIQLTELRQNRDCWQTGPFCGSRCRNERQHQSSLEGFGC